MLGAMLERLHQKAPLIHCITNYVTANDCANLLLACGASPIMSDSPDEAAEVASICGGVVLNTGTLSRERLNAMLAAGRAANALGIPAVLDPVGAGSSSFRTRAVLTLLKEIHFQAIRANLSELRAIAGTAEPKRGVDADDLQNAADETAEDTAESLRQLSRQLGTVVAATGKTDFITDGKNEFRIRGGSALLRLVTGAGCQLSALTGAFLAANPQNVLEASAAAACMMKVCGELAAERMTSRDGTASFRTYVIDAAYLLMPETLNQRAVLEQIH